MSINIDDLLRMANEKQASDVHITVGLPPIIRINGELIRYGDEGLRPEDTEKIARTVIPQDQWEHFIKNKDLDFSYGIPGVSRFRINAYFQRSCIGLAIRIIPRHIPNLEELNMPSVLKDMATKPQGLILVTGPTGSGKSTTLAAMIHHMNQHMNRNIITLEDPIEYLHRHNKCIIDQRAIGFDTNNFAVGLRSALRQDPDVILVGEMRDLETISTAITAAETGHLVLSTLHTTDAASTIDRMIDVFPPNQQTQIRVQLASVMVGVISQRLFPTMDKNGRRAATEILINNNAVANLIRNNKIHQLHNVMQTSRSAGMHTLEASMNDLVKEGVISREVILPYLNERGYDKDGSI